MANFVGHHAHVSEDGNSHPLAAPSSFAVSMADNSADVDLQRRLMAYNSGRGETSETTVAQNSMVQEGGIEPALPTGGSVQDGLVPTMPTGGEQTMAPAHNGGFHQLTPPTSEGAGAEDSADCEGVSTGVHGRVGGGDETGHQSNPAKVACQKDADGKNKRFKCSRCPRKGVQNGKNDGVACTNCFNKANERAVRTAVAAVQPQQQTNQSLDPIDIGQDKDNKIKLEFGSFDEARDHIIQPSAKYCEIHRFVNDDWKAVKEATRSKQLCAELYAALGHPPKTMFSEDNQDLQAYYTASVKASFDRTRGNLKTESQRAMAQANAFVTVYTAISVHEHGFPKVAMENGRAIAPDVVSICSKRVDAIIDIVKDCVYAKADLVDGKTRTLVWNPDEYLKAKDANIVSNHTKQVAAKERKAKAEEEKAEAEVDVEDGEQFVVETPKKRVRKVHKVKKAKKVNVDQPSAIEIGNQAAIPGGMQPSSNPRGKRPREIDQSDDAGPSQKRVQVHGGPIDPALLDTAEPVIPMAVQQVPQQTAFGGPADENLINSVPHGPVSITQTQVPLLVIDHHQTSLKSFSGTAYGVEYPMQNGFHGVPSAEVGGEREQAIVQETMSASVNNGVDAGFGMFQTHGTGAIDQTGMVAPDGLEENFVSAADGYPDPSNHEAFETWFNLHFPLAADTTTFGDHQQGANADFAPQ